MSESPFEFSIASWNVHLGVHNNGGRNDVVGRCRDLDADVLVLQESWWYDEPDSPFAPDVASALGYRLHEHVAEPEAGSDRTASFRVVILTRIAANPLRHHTLPGPGSERGMVRIEVGTHQIRICGGHLLGIHALWRRPATWVRERAALKDAAATNDVVVGDLNMWGPVVKRDAGGLRPAVIGRTWPSARPHSQIDHMLVSERLEVLHGEVLEDMGSDHRAIRAVLRVR